MKFDPVSSSNQGGEEAMKCDCATFPGYRVRHHLSFIEYLTRARYDIPFFMFYSIEAPSTSPQTLEPRLNRLLNRISATGLEFPQIG